MDKTTTVATAPTIVVEPQRALVDEQLSIRVMGLPPGRRVTVRAQQPDDFGRAWTAHADFVADGRGTVDLAAQPPVAGAYDEADPMGLFWSMALAPDEPNQAPFFRATPTPLTVTFTAEVDGATVATAAHERLYVAPGVTRTDVRDDGLVATFFLPPGPRPHPAVISVGGSGGGLYEGGAALYASHGFASLALAYFNVEPLPPDLVDIPLEYFETAIAWLQRQPGVRGDRIAVSGTSRGGELALLLGATFPAIRAVVAYVPSGVVHGGISRDGRRGERAAWTHHGEPVPYLQPKQPSAPQPSRPDGGPVDLTPLFLRSLEDGDAAARAEIPVERINGPVLLISGKDDRLWPSTPLAEIAVRRLARHNHPYPYTHLAYEHAGHMIGTPYTPATVLASRHALTGGFFSYGGTAAGTARARAHSWREVLSFLDVLGREVGDGLT